MEEKTSIITDKVGKMFLEYGIRGVTMEDVSYKLGISKKTLYQYFEDKSKLIEAVLESIAWRRFKDLEKLENHGNAIDQLFCYHKIQREMIKNHKPAFAYDLEKYYPDLYEKFQKLKLDKMIEAVKSNTEEGIEQGLYRNDLDPGVIARLTVLRAEAIIRSDFFTYDEFLTTNLFTEILKYHIFGIVSDKGREIFKHRIDEFNTPEK